MSYSSGNAMAKRGALVAALLIGCLGFLLNAAPTRAATDESVGQDGIVLQIEEGAVSSVSANDTANLLEQYVEERLEASAQTSEVSLSKAQRQSAALTGNEGLVYAQLEDLAIRVAAGDVSSTELQIPLDEFENVTLAWTADELGVETVSDGEVESNVSAQAQEEALQRVASEAAVDMDLIVSSLMANHPYELYWYDKTAGTASELTVYLTVQTVDEVERLCASGYFCVRMSVSQAYSSGDYQVNQEIGARVEEAVEKARDIVDGCSDEDTWTRLAVYKDAVCELVSYDEEAADGADTAYGDQWQIISVFDDDATTNVVCEGYAKAFQYLCDLSDFEDACCLSVTGLMTGGLGEGLHMWNVVNVSASGNYLVDVTNCDEGTVGYPDLLFMQGYLSGGIDEGYTFSGSGDTTVTYQYDQSARTLYSDKELTLVAKGESGGSGSAEEFSLSEGWDQLGTCESKLEDGVLTIRPLGNGTSGVMRDCDNYLPWKDQRASIVRAVIRPGVKSGSSLYRMFGGCTNLTSVDLSGLDTSACTDMNSMFFDCTSLTELDLSSFDTSHVEGNAGLWDSGMADMFSGCESLTKLDLSGWDTSKVRYMNNMFSECSKLTGLDVSHFDTSSVHDFSCMFAGCSSLTGLDVSHFDTSNAENMGGMFSGCSSLKTLDVSEFDTGNVTGIDAPDLTGGVIKWYSGLMGMFQGCSSLGAIDVSAWDVSDVVDMSHMFKDSGITSIDLSGWNPVSVTDMGGIFEGCTRLRAVYADGLDVPELVSIRGMFEGCSSLTGIHMSNWDSPSLLNLTGLCAECPALTTADFSYLDVSNIEGQPDSVEDMGFAFLFSGCSKLKSLNLSGWKPKKLRRIEEMFRGCSSLVSLDLSGWDVSSVSNFSWVFQDCGKLATLNLSGWNPASGVNFESMFNGCLSLKSLDISRWDMGKAVNTSKMFSVCPSLTTLKISNWDVSNVANMSDMFRDSGLTSIDLRGWNPVSVTDMSCIFERCNKLRVVYVDGFNVPKIKTIRSMFDGCESLINIHMSNWNSPSLANVVRMCADCPALTTADFSNLGVANVKGKLGSVEDTGFAYLFCDCSKLKSLNLSGWKPKKLRRIEEMFRGCSSLVSLDLSGWDVSSVKSFSQMFSECSKLVSLNLSGWNPASGTNFESMFSGCSSLKSLSISSWDMRKAKSTCNMFGSCHSLQKLDLSGWRTPNLKNTDSMFVNCKSLNVLNLSRLDTRKVTKYDSMFHMGKKCSLGVIKIGSNYKMKSYEMFPSGAENQAFKWTSKATGEEYYDWTIAKKRSCKADTYYSKKYKGKKRANTMKVKAKKKVVTVKHSDVEQRQISTATNIKVSKARGAVAYKNVSKNSTAKKFSVNKNYGGITIPRGTKKGTYRVKVRVTAKGNSLYKGVSRTVTFTIKVR